MDMLILWSAICDQPWGYSLTALFITFIWAIILHFMKYKKKRALTPNKVLFIGTFVSSFLYFLPMYSIEYSAFPAVLNSLLHVFRIFAIDGDYVTSIAEFEYFPAHIKSYYLSLGSFLYVFAPTLTFGFILSFFKNLGAHLKYSLCFWARTHVFSELNEKTLTLAQNLMKEKRNKNFLFFPKSLIVFTDIVDKKEEQSLELIEDAMELGAILFRKDLESVRFKRRFPFSFRKVYFYLISEDESEKIRHAESIIKHYDYKKVSLKVFSDDVRTELLLAAKPVKNMRLSRINDIQSLIYHNLYKDGANLFKRARVINQEKDKNGNIIKEERLISVIIVGLGKYGCEMLKALTWFCQLTNHKLKINVFDTDSNACEKFKNMCPELMEDKYNNNDIQGEPHYKIKIHPGIDVSVPAFETKLRVIDDASYIFVCLGDDAVNLDVATKIRAMCERIDYQYPNCDGVYSKPDIETIIYDSTLKKSMGITWDDVMGISRKEKKGFWKKLITIVSENICKGVSCIVCKITGKSKDAQEETPKKAPKGLSNYKGQAYNILISGDLENFYASETVINSQLVKEGFAMHVAYNLVTSKFEFAEKRIDHQRWDEFLKSQKLEESWNECKKEKNDQSSLDFRDFNKNFSYYTKDENDELKKIENDSTLSPEEKAQRKAEFEKSLSRCVLNRINEWRKIVYEEFDKLMKINSFARMWKKERKKILSQSEKSFRFEYNYRSSITKAIHRQLLINYNPENIPVDKKWEDMNLDDKLKVAYIEHIRWNAYMRTEGYCHSDSIRNDLAKQHTMLVPVTALSLSDLSKDAYGCPENVD